MITETNWKSRIVRTFPVKCHFTFNGNEVFNQIIRNFIEEKSHAIVHYLHLSHLCFFVYSNVFFYVSIT